MKRTIAVASTNPVKIRAVQEGFQRMFPGQEWEMLAVPAPSLVGNQPFSDEETLTGAFNRARGAAGLQPLADYWVGIEGGIEVHGTEMAAYAWVVILGGGQEGKSRTGIFYLPRRVAELIHAGKELGEADDIVFGRSNSKQENGAIGLLTGDVIDRVQLYEHAVILALVPFKNPALYAPASDS
jgi:inosine/xanthosine triphosphatase